MTRLPMLGRTYRYAYGYPWRYAVAAEVCWRIEHLPGYRGDGWRIFDRARSFGYRWRKHFERHGSPLLRSSHDQGDGR